MIMKLLVITTMLEIASDALKDAYELLLKALPRCQNCGKPMDKAICPFCGDVQRLEIAMDDKISTRVAEIEGDQRSRVRQMYKDLAEK